VLAVVALGVAIYAVTRDDNTSRGSRKGVASDERVTRVDGRVDRLSRQLQSVRASRPAHGGCEPSFAGALVALSAMQRWAVRQRYALVAVALVAGVGRGV
jgi:hypothetical protein